METGLGSKPHPWVKDYSITSQTVPACGLDLPCWHLTCLCLLMFSGIQEAAPPDAWHLSPLIAFTKDSLSFLYIFSLLFSLEPSFAKQVEEFPLKDLHRFMLPSLFINGTTFSLISLFPSDAFVKALLPALTPWIRIAEPLGSPPSLSLSFPLTPAGMHFCLLPYILLLSQIFKWF